MDFFPSLGGVRKTINREPAGSSLWFFIILLGMMVNEEASVELHGHTVVSAIRAQREEDTLPNWHSTPGGQATLLLGWSRRSKIWTRPSFLVWGEYCTYIFPETLYWDIHNLLPKECCDSWRIHYSGSLGIGECVMKPYVTYPRSSALIETLFGTSCQLQRIFGKRMWKDVEKRFDFAQL